MLLAYFTEGLKDKSSATLISVYSILKSTIQAYENKDISQYKKLQALLKKSHVGYKPKKSKILEDDDIRKFLAEAPDLIYLLCKVILVMGISGGCRKSELYGIGLKNLEEKDGVLIVHLPNTKNHKPRSFALTGEFYDIYIK